MLAKLFIIFLLITLSANTFAQKQNVYYLKNDLTLVDTKDSADYIRVLREPDSGSLFYNVLEYYKNGNRKLIGKTSKIDYNILQEQCVEFHDNGNRRLLATYQNGVIINQAFEYFPNGKLQSIKNYPSDSKNTPPNQDDSGNQGIRIQACYDSTGKELLVDGNGTFIGYHSNYKLYEQGPVKNGLRDSIWNGFADKEQKQPFIEHYFEGKLVSGTATDSQGTYNYTERVVRPSYKKGIDAFYQYLSNNIAYPFNAKRNRIQGLVMLSFVVEKDGHISQIKVVKSVNEELDSEAKRVLAKSKNWIPGMRFGKPVSVVCTSPINFSLRD